MKTRPHTNNSGGKNTSTYFDDLYAAAIEDGLLAAVVEGQVGNLAFASTSKQFQITNENGRIIFSGGKPLRRLMNSYLDTIGTGFNVGSHVGNAADQLLARRHVAARAMAIRADTLKKNSGGDDDPVMLAVRDYAQVHANANARAMNLSPAAVERIIEQGEVQFEESLRLQGRVRDFSNQMDELLTSWTTTGRPTVANVQTAITRLQSSYCDLLTPAPKTSSAVTSAFRNLSMARMLQRLTEACGLARIPALDIAEQKYFGDFRFGWPDASSALEQTLSRATQQAAAMWSPVNNLREEGPLRGKTDECRMAISAAFSQGPASVQELIVRLRMQLGNLVECIQTPDFSNLAHETAYRDGVLLLACDQALQQIPLVMAKSQVGIEGVHMITSIPTTAIEMAALTKQVQQDPRHRNIADAQLAKLLQTSERDDVDLLSRSIEHSASALGKQIELGTLPQALQAAAQPVRLALGASLLNQASERNGELTDRMRSLVKGVALTLNLRAERDMTATFNATNNLPHL